MTVTAPTALYVEHPLSVTTREEVDRALADLERGKARWRSTPLVERVKLAERCRDGALALSRIWVDAACQAKGLAEGSPLRGEEVSAGPLATLRYLHLLAAGLRDTAGCGAPKLPGRAKTVVGQRCAIPVMPTQGLYDSLLFQGFRAHVWLQPGATFEEEQRLRKERCREALDASGIALVLGAGNVSSIAPTDVFSKLFQEGKVCLLKMNPVNEYLGPIFEQAFSALIEGGFLRIIYGGADVGSYAIGHAMVDEVHITGSVYSHESIVWGSPGEERERRKAENRPLLQKRITSELGNVTPWIVLPGPYTERQLRFQAENTAAMIVNNASFNCIAAKVIVTWKHWPQRKRFLELVQEALDRVPPRQAYYPGAADRFRRFAGAEPSGPEGTLPWTLVRDVDSTRESQYFEEESFVCVVAETSLEAATEESFCEAAVEFANERLWGTLGAGLLAHPAFRKRNNNEELLQRSIGALRYGTVALNHWPALAYAMMSPPWGGYPSATLADPQSGLGWVHNTYMLQQIEKTVLEGPLTLFPKPFWFPSSRGAERLGWKVVDLYAKPSAWKLPGILASAVMG